MKNAAFVFLIIPFFLCCTKTDTPPQPSPPQPSPPAQDSLLKSWTLYLPQTHVKETQYLSYNQSQQLAQLRAITYDSSSNTPTGVPETDSFNIRFTLTDAATPPAAYDLTSFLSEVPSGAAEHHILFYDSLKRVIRDSTGSNTANFNTRMDFFYDDRGNISIFWMFPDTQVSTGYAPRSIDTLVVPSGNVLTNINYDVSYSYDGNGGYVITSEDFNYLYTRNYSTYANPLYNIGLSSSLGPVFVFNSFGDFLSKNLPNEYGDQSSSSFTILSYVWKTDTAGRVISGFGTNTDTGVVTEVYTFNY